jgi:outer membrane receptor for ferrienterochelin and colicins
MSTYRRSLQVALAVAVSLLLSARPAWSQPVTVITDTMIADLGARTLRDVLITYVPGMTMSQDHNEVNIAMRGVYASAQQKILIVVDGHVLNSRSYSAASPDFGISLDKVKRIEVLRGPASALYGNGALTAVVNITTRTAADSAGAGEAMVSASVGTYGQVRGSALFTATTTRGSDLVAWGTFYKSDGEVVDIPAAADYSRNPGNSQAILDGFRDRPSHDVGLKLKTRSFTFTAAHRYGKYIEPFTAGGPTGESYVYSDYQRGHGEGPGLSEGSLNLGMSHERVLAPGTTVQVRGYFDRIDHRGHLVSDPSQGAHALVTWSEWDAGGVVQVNRDYTSGGRQGLWRVGAQADFMRVDDSILSTGTGGGWSTTSPSGGLLSLGDEKMYSAFANVTHPLSAKWTASAAVRYDLKDRRDDENLHVVSPSVAFTYQPGARASVAVSYGRSFVDAPYFYRYNALASYRGARTLKPEYLKSVQVTPSVTLGRNATWTSNVFFSHLDSLVYRNNAAGPNDPIYQNAGFLRTWGIEQEIGWANDRLDLKGNVTFQRATSAENYAITGTDVHNVPTWSSNAIITVRPAFARAQQLALNATVRVVGAQKSPIDVTVGNRVFREPDRTVDGVVLVNLGARLGALWSRPWFLDARVYNLFDRDYEQGGSVSHPYPQPGRWMTVTLGRRW